PMCLARKTKDVKGLRIYFDAGTKDRYGFGPANEQLDKVLKENGIEHTFHLIEGGEHSWNGGTVQKALVESLQFVGAGFAPGFARDKPKPEAETPRAAPVSPPPEPKKPTGGP